MNMLLSDQISVRCGVCYFLILKEHPHLQTIFQVFLVGHFMKRWLANALWLYWTGFELINKSSLVEPKI